MNARPPSGERTRPRVPVSAPSPKQSFCDAVNEKVRDDEGVIASTRGRVRSPIQK
jgi:hypothetical protein